MPETYLKTKAKPRIERSNEVKHQPRKLLGVLDVGSNSVRLVVFAGNRRVPEPVFNEKVLCGLGRQVGISGELGETEMEMAFAALRRFRLVADSMGLKKVHAIGTAAVREATNGPAFLKRVRDEIGFDIEVISGEEEGRLAAEGIFCGLPSASGVVGDLGGGSLELAWVSRSRQKQVVSLPLGPLHLMARFGDDLGATYDYVVEELHKVDWLSGRRNKDFYMVGGAWRNIAKLLMLERQEVLPILHGYRIERKDMQRYLRILALVSPENVPYSSHITGRRRAVLPHAAAVLGAILKVMKPSHLVVSSYGVREGVLFGTMSKAQRRKDPFLVSCETLAQERSRFPEHAEALYRWTRSLLNGVPGHFTKEEARLHLAACYLSDIAWRCHPDFKAEYAVDQALFGHYVGVGHKDRAFVGVVLNESYGAKLEGSKAGSTLQLLEADEIQRARVLGAGLRLAQRMSAGTMSLLSECEMDFSKGMITLTASPFFDALAGDVVSQRLRDIGKLLGVSTTVQIRKNITPPAEIDIEDL